MRIVWQGETFELLPEKAIFWPRQKTLFVADPHFGKAAVFRKAGIPITERTTEDDLVRLGEILDRTGSEKLVFLGDFIHARQSRTQALRNLLFQWREKFSRLQVHLIRGNHDLKSGDPWTELKIDCHDEPWNRFGWSCRHHPAEPDSGPYFAGHIHPGFSLRGRARGSIRSACFQVGINRIILPAFGSFTGLKNVRREREDRIFLTDGNQIIALPVKDRSIT